MPKVEPALRAAFKESARRIISSDRQARKYGLSQNAIGQIERAMVYAYELGKQSGIIVSKSNLDVKGAVNWIEIPPRARDTLRSMTYSYSARFSEPTYEAASLERMTERGKIRWGLVYNDRVPERTVSDGSVAPLLRLGLVKEIDEAGRTLSITKKGELTCLEFWKREDTDDPSLPIMSAR